MADVSIKARSAWCSDCRAAATHQCWDEHEVHNTRAALRLQLQGALPQAAAQLQGLQDQCQGEQAVQALTLLTAESWDLTLRAGDRVLTGTVRNTEDPVTKTLCLLLAARAALAGAQTVAPLERRNATRSPSPPAVAHRQTELNLSELSLSEPHQRQQEKADTLRRAGGVKSLHFLNCAKDPAWSLRLLQCVASTVEEMSVYEMREAHLRAVHGMPRLRSLKVYLIEDVCEDASRPPVLPALPPGHGGGLQRLMVYGTLPRETLVSLLEAHAHTLQELGISTYTSGRTSGRALLKKLGVDDDDFLSVLGQCGLQLRALRRVELIRPFGCAGIDSAYCKQQRDEVRRLLPLPEAEVLFSDDS